MKRKAFLLSLALLSVDLHGKQIGEIDLVRHQAVGPEPYKDNIVPEGCGSSSYYDSDGVIKHKRSNLKIELTLLKEGKFQRGETIQATVLMQNTGIDAVVIPWSSDPHVGERPPGMVQHEYEEGWFDAELTGSSKIRVPLEMKSVSRYLYSSPSVPQSTLRIEPGQWIVARVSFVIAEKHKLSERLPIEPGIGAIKVEWRQVRYTWRRNGCAVKNGYFNHRYNEDQNTVAVDILP